MELSLKDTSTAQDFMKDKALEIAVKMFKSGKSLEQIYNITGITKEDIKNIKDENELGQYPDLFKSIIKYQSINVALKMYKARIQTEEILEFTGLTKEEFKENLELLGNKVADIARKLLELDVETEKIIKATDLSYSYVELLKIELEKAKK